jgi:hypothetical protein
MQSPTSNLTTAQPLEDNSALQSEEKQMEWTIVEDHSGSGDWRVEGIDFDNEGKVYVAIFSGPDARYRAGEYTEWKKSLQLLGKAA